MLKQWFKTPRRELSRVFKTEDTRFAISVGLKVSGISLGVTFFVYYYLFTILRLNFGFFSTQGFPEFGDESPFFGYIIQETLENLPFLFLFHISLFFIGVYAGWLIIRPFRVLGEYAESVIENVNYIYKVEEFSNYKLLTRFSEFFFEYLRDARIKKILIPNSIPPQFLRIHRPVRDYVFMFHFGILLLLIGISNCFFIVENSSGIYMTMIELAMKTLKSGDSMNKFFSSQSFVLNEMVYLTAFLVSIFYFLLALHLYAKVSGAAFGIFSTMRSFMKGNFNSRIHLVGYGHVREYTRKLNKYLDHIQNNLVKAKQDS